MEQHKAICLFLQKKTQCTGAESAGQNLSAKMDTAIYLVKKSLSRENFFTIHIFIDNLT